MFPPGAITGFPARSCFRASFLSDILPAGYMGAGMCGITHGDVAVRGAGPVGQFAIASARLLGAERVIAIDRFPYRLRMAQEKAGATDVIDHTGQPVLDALDELTAGRGPDARIDAVGLEGHAALRDLPTRRPTASRSS